MAYSDFTLEAIVEQQQLQIQDVRLFPNMTAVAPSPWLQETLSISATVGLFSGTEKARSEFIVAPILLELEKRNLNQFSIFSGKSLDVDRAQGLNGECDFILSKGAPSRLIQAPIFSLVEAKKQDIDIGLGQCIAQMIGAQLFNQRKQKAIEIIYGCVTTADRWQFLQLQQQDLAIDQHVYSYPIELDKILGVFQLILNQV